MKHFFLGFKIVMPICKTMDGEQTDVDNCNIESKPDKIILPCNTQPCSTK